MSPTIPAFGRPIWAGFYYAAGRYGDFQPKANCQILALKDFADGDGHLPVDGRPRFLNAVRQTPALFADAADLPLLVNRDLADIVAGVVLAEHDTADQIESEARTARLMLQAADLGHLPVIATLTPDQVFSPAWRFPGNVGGWAVECYLPSPERDFLTAALRTQNRLDAILMALDGRPAYLIVQTYDRLQAWQGGALAGHLSACASRAAANHTIRGLWFFAYSRPGGVQDYPVLEAWTDAIVDQAGQPSKGEPVEVTISEYRPTTGARPLRVRAVADIVSGNPHTLTWRYRRPGGPWIVAAVNPAEDLDHTFTFEDAGTFEIGLLAEGPTGSDETTRPRIVTVQDPTPQPEPEPPSVLTSPMASGQRLSGGQRLRSRNGRYDLNVQTDGNLVLYRRSNTDALWSTHTQGVDGPMILNMQPDGNLVLYGGDEAVWASNTFDRGAGVNLSDVGELTVGAALIVPVDPTPDPEPDSEFPGASGRVRFLGSRAVQDDSGSKLYVGLSRFAWLWFWKYDRDRVLRELDADRAAGYRFGRVLAQVGDPKDRSDFWVGRIVDPDWSNYQDLIAGLTQAAIERDHLIAWTIIGKGGPYDTGASQRGRLIDRVGPVLATVADGVLFQEVMNEPAAGHDVSPDEMLALAQRLKALNPASPTATGAVWSDQGATAFTADAWRATQFEVGIAHIDRDTSKGEKQDRPWRQAWDVGLEGRRWCENEGIGPGSSISSETRPAVLRSHRAVAFICRAFASVLHGKPGVRGDQKWEDEPAYLEAPKAARFLPGDLPNGSPHNANPKFPNRPFTLDPAYTRADNGNTAGIVRAYTNELDGVFYTVPFGPISPYELRAERNLKVLCFQQDINDLVWERDVVAGERLRFDNPAVDYLLVSRPR